MSDREGVPGAAGDDELSLPKATVAKMISGASEFPSSFLSTARHYLRCLTYVRVDHGAHGKIELLPNEVTCAKETRDLIIECCVGTCAPFHSIYLT